MKYWTIYTDMMLTAGKMLRQARGRRPGTPYFIGFFGISTGRR